MIKHKQELYKTAFSPMYKKYVGINKAYQKDGVWMYECIMDKMYLILFSENELEAFCL